MVVPADTRVLDASAVLAFAQDEPGSQTIAAALARSVISSVNWAEVVQKALARGVDVSGLRDDLLALGMDIMPFTAEDAEQAALLWPRTKALGLSLGDRACLALGVKLGVPVLTADRSWLNVSGAQVQVIR